jgi:hypothetical protein
MVSITFNTVAGQRYRVEYKEALDLAGWTELAPAQTALGPSLTVFDSVNAATQRFYRAVRVP